MFPCVRRLSVHITLALFTILMLSLFSTTNAKPTTIKRYPSDLFSMGPKDELCGPFYGPVRKATIRFGEAYWSVTFARDGTPMQRVENVPGSTQLYVSYDETGRPVESMKVFRSQRDYRTIQYNDANQTFNIDSRNYGTLNSKGLIKSSISDTKSGFYYNQEWEYTSDGLIGKHVVHTPILGVTTFERIYDSAGRTLSCIVYNQLKTSTGPSTSMTQTDYRYDTSGHLTTIVYREGVVPVEDTWDSFSNWTTRKLFYRNSDGSIVTKTFTQEIEYYQ